MLVAGAEPSSVADPLRTRSQSVTEALRELIVQGELKPGQHVQEVPLAEQLGVSRTPVRTALNTLANEGFLVYQPNKGYFVRQFDIAEILEVYEVRAALESLAAHYRLVLKGLKEPKALGRRKRVNETPDRRGTHLCWFAKARVAIARLHYELPAN